VWRLVIRKGIDDSLTPLHVLDTERHTLLVSVVHPPVPSPMYVEIIRYSGQKISWVWGWGYRLQPREVLPEHFSGWAWPCSVPD